MGKERLIAIGDIHGCYHTLIDLMQKIGLDVKTDTLVFVGDYIDRGPYSCEVVQYLRNLQRTMGEDACICLRGNHEQMAIEANGELNDLRIMNGGEATQWSYHDNSRELVDDLLWFKWLPLVYDTQEVLFCHAGLTHPTFEDNSSYDLLWGREWIQSDPRPRIKQVVFGHTPRDTFRPYTTSSGDICIDSGCVFGGNLCALILKDDGSDAEFISVKKSKKDVFTF